MSQDRRPSPILDKSREDVFAPKLTGERSPAELERRPLAEFTLRDTSSGQELTPETIGLWQFNEFNNQVEQFLAGTKRKAELGHVGVKIEPGSYRLSAMISAALAAFLSKDMELLETEQDCLGQIDPKRAEVVLSWQAQAKKNASRSIGVRLRGEFQSSFELRSDTDYKLVEPPLVDVDEYIVGTITDLGGAHEANIHLRLEDNPKVILTIAADRNYLSAQTDNLVYRKFLLHVTAKQNLTTKEKRHYRLVEFVRVYKPYFDQKAISEAAEVGHEIWADVEDAAAWVRFIRGGKR